MLGAGVGGAHDLWRQVRTDGDGGEIERAEALAGLAEPVEVARVPADVEAPGGADHDALQWGRRQGGQAPRDTL
jgi:hypothetical protein